MTIPDGQGVSTSKTAIGLEATFRASEYYKKFIADVNSYEAKLHDSENPNVGQFRGAVEEGKSKHVSK